MAKILVTGGCGYIGSHTIVDLLKMDLKLFLLTITAGQTRLFWKA